MTPTTDDPLAAVLADIDEIEGREGFEGPKISKWISNAVAFLGQPRIWGTPDDRMIQLLYSDAIVGAVGRACDARGWALKIDGSYGDEEPYIVSVVVSCHPNHYKSHDSWGHSRAIAAASAYQKAIGGGDQG